MSKFAINIYDMAYEEKVPVDLNFSDGSYRVKMEILHLVDGSREGGFMRLCGLPNRTRKIQIQHYHSPCGDLMLGSFEGRLCLCNWSREKHPGRVERRLRNILDAGYEERMSDTVGEAIKQLDEYFGGERTAFDIPLLLVGTDFQRCVWNLLLEIPYGQTVSYIGLSERLGCPRAVRAVANANGANTISIFVPCHRVIGSDRSLTGYGGGVEAKKFLLELERHGSPI